MSTVKLRRRKHLVGPYDGPAVRAEDHNGQRRIKKVVLGDGVRAAGDGGDVLRFVSVDGNSVV